MSLQTTLKSPAAAYYEREEQTDANPEKQSDLPASLDRDRVLDSAQAAKFLGLSVPHFRRLYRSKKVPSPIKIGERKYGWQIGVLVDFVATKSRTAA